MAKKKDKTFTSREQALNYFIKKERSKSYKAQAKEQLERLKKGNISTALLRTQIKTQQANQRQKAIEVLGGRAEQLEIWAVNLNEVPMLHDMERQRTRVCTPDDFSYSKTISNAQRICTPDDKLNLLKEKFDVSQLPD